MISVDVDIIERLDGIEAALAEIVRGRRVKELYTVAEVAERLAITGGRVTSGGP